MSTQQEVIDFMENEFPQFEGIVEKVGNRSSLLRRKIDNNDLRPGGTVSGPVLMSVADAALYVAILGEIGIVGLAMTTSLNINFLNKPASDRDVIADCKLIKVGKSLVVGEVTLYSDGNSEPVAHVVGTYSIPPKKK